MTAITPLTHTAPDLHLCIATGQNLANLIPALQCGAREVWILQTPTMLDQAAHLADALKSRGIAAQRIDFADTNVNALHASAGAIAERLNDRAVTINLSGGTKMMTLALTETLASHLATGGSAAEPHLVYTDTLHRRLDWLRPFPRSEPMADVLTLNDILLAQGYRQQEGSGGTDAAIAQRRAESRKLLTRHLGDEAQQIDAAFGDLNRVARAAMGDHERNFCPEQTINLPAGLKHREQLRQALKRIVDAGDLLHWDERQKKVNFQNWQAASYICGGWVEEYAASKLRAVESSRRASPLWVATLGGTRNELDAVVVHGNRMLVIECKAAATQDDSKLADWIYKLNQLARAVGGQMTQPLLLSARAVGDVPRQRAKEYGIDILAAGQLQSLPDYLRRWMAGLPGITC